MQHQTLFVTKGGGSPYGWGHVIFVPIGMEVWAHCLLWRAGQPSRANSHPQALHIELFSNPACPSSCLTLVSLLCSCGTANGHPGSIASLPALLRWMFLQGSGHGEPAPSDPNCQLRELNGPSRRCMGGSPPRLPDVSCDPQLIDSL